MTSQSTTYTPTLMQHLLGRNYKWWYLFLHSFKANTVNRLSMLSWFLSSLVFLTSNLIIWYSNQSSGTFDFDYIFTYFVIGQIFILQGGLFYDLAEDISYGKLNTKLLMPSSLFLRYIFRDLGWNGFSRFIVQPVVYCSIAIILNQFMVLPSFIHFILFVCGCVLSYSIFVLTGIIMGSFAFWFPDAWGLIDMFRTISDFTSGRYFPLSIIWFVYPLIYTPFAFTYFHTLELYFGTYSPLETFYVFLGGIGWCIMLYFLANYIFKRGLKRNEAVGL